MDDGSGWTVSGLSCVLYLNHQKKNSSKLEIRIGHCRVVGGSGGGEMTCYFIKGARSGSLARGF
jgi:hypothetical protein